MGPVPRRLASSFPQADLAAAAHFLWGLPGFLRRPLSLSEAHIILRRRFECREQDFLTLVRAAIFEHRASPYATLLRWAGCEYGDLSRLVQQDGLEGALQTLWQRGVYLTVDEFKGRQLVVRGSATLALDPTELQNPRVVAQLRLGSSGSRGSRTVVPVELGFVQEQAVVLALAFDARAGSSWLRALWGVPGASAMMRFLEFCKLEPRPVHWYSQVDPASRGLHPRYRWSARAMWAGGRLAGVRVPYPKHVSLDAPLPIVRWMAATLQAGRTPHLHTFASSAVRVCQAALDSGLEIRGAQFTVSGEPLTAACLAVIRRAGAEAVPRYGSTETGLMGYGCLEPVWPDDMHLLHHLHAVVRPAALAQRDRLSTGSLLVSSLRLTAPIVLLNVSLGDQAEVAPRSCGCPLEQLGWTTHLHAIRSQEKLTAGGMTFLDADVIRILEEVLPARFGGGPTNYQLVESQTDQGQPRLQLLVDPSVGPLDEAALSEAFFAALGAGSAGEQVMALQWRQGGVLRVERRRPLATASGKILHLHHERQPAATPGA